MKKFSFPLERVLDWRNTQQRIAEASLATLNFDLRALAMARARLDADERDTSRALLTAQSIDAAELAAWEDYRRWVSSEHRRLDAREAALNSQAEDVRKRLMDRRREVKLVEHLKDKKHRVWEAGYSREIEAEASESYRSRSV